MSDRAAFLLARIAELYSVAPRAIERIARGMDTENWRIDTDRRREHVSQSLPAAI